MIHYKVKGKVLFVQNDGMRTTTYEGKTQTRLDARAIIEIEGGSMLQVVPGYNCNPEKFQALKVGAVSEFSLCLDDTTRVDL